MRWTSNTWRKRTAKLEKTTWHRWFAWYPIDIDGTSVWLETVEKKGRLVSVGEQSIMQYSYRLTTKS